MILIKKLSFWQIFSIKKMQQLLSTVVPEDYFMRQV